MAGFDYGPGLLRVRASMVRRYAMRDGTEERAMWKAISHSIALVSRPMAWPLLETGRKR